MAVVGHATPLAFPPWSTHDWSSVLLEKLGHESVLSSGASFFPVDGASLTIPRLTIDADAAAWIAPGGEFPTDDVQGDSIKLEPKKLGIVTGIDVEAIEDASVATLDVVGNSLARALATKLDARIFSTTAADGPAGLLGAFTPLAEALGVIPLLKAVATIQAAGGNPDTIYVSPGDWVDLRTEPVETGSSLPLLGVDVSATGAKTVDGLALRDCPALPAGKAVVAEARQIIVGIARAVTVVASSEARFTSDVVLVKAASDVTSRPTTRWAWCWSAHEPEAHSEDAGLAAGPGSALQERGTGGGTALHERTRASRTSDFRRAHTLVPERTRTTEAEDQAHDDGEADGGEEDHQEGDQGDVSRLVVAELWTGSVVVRRLRFDDSASQVEHVDQMTDASAAARAAPRWRAVTHSAPADDAHRGIFER